MGFIQSLGRRSAEALAIGRRYADRAIASKVARYGIIGGGAAAYMATRNSNSGVMRGIGDIGGIAALGLGGYGAYRSLGTDATKWPWRSAEAKIPGLRWGKKASSGLKGAWDAMPLKGKGWQATKPA